MTPKEKAEELFNKADMIIYTDADYKSQCKSVAMLCVDQIIQSHEAANEYVTEEINMYLNWWKQVKQEIINLK
jgi:hypothetical protein